MAATKHFRGAHMKVSCLSVSALLVLACATVPAVAGEGRSISNVNGSVRASPGVAYDSLTTVNGDVRVAKGATAEVAKSVNGEVVLESNTTVGRVSTVNGSVRVEDGATVAHEASTVNGSVTLGKGSRVGGDVSSVSGEIELEGAEVAGKLSTYNGDIELEGGSRVLGGIHIKKPRDSDNGWRHNSPPEVHICSTCVVQGELRFDRPVELRVDPGAKIGAVIGDQVTRR
jgi:DUF4097 and DUF4098 domain-containing protein YvlB